MKTSRDAAVERVALRERISAWLDDDVQAWSADDTLDDALSSAGRHCAAEYQQVGALLRSAASPAVVGGRAFVARVMVAVEAERPLALPAADDGRGATLLWWRPRLRAGWGGAALAAAAGIAGWAVFDSLHPPSLGSTSIVAAVKPSAAPLVAGAPVVTLPGIPRAAVRLVSTAAPAVQDQAASPNAEPAAEAIPAVASSGSATPASALVPSVETVEPTELGPMRRDPDLDAYLRSRQLEAAEPSAAP